MPQPLGPTDSFNSSTATIVPDKKRVDPNIPNNHRIYPPDTNSSRALVSSNSLEGHINSALRVNAGGDDGMIGLLHTQTEDMGGNSLSGLSFMREFINIPPDDSQHPTPSSSQNSSGPTLRTPNPLGHMNFNSTPQTHNNTFEPIPSPQSTYEPLQSPHSTFDPIPSPNPSIHSNPFSTLTSPVNPQPEYPFRPSSVNSHHSAAGSSVDASDYYSTTDMDTDEDDLSSIHDVPPLAVNANIGDLGMGDMDLTGKPAIMTWTPYQPQNNAISPQDVHSQSVSPNDMTQSYQRASTRNGNSSGPPKSGRKTSGKSTTGMSEEDKIKADKLEHRRDINRRSAQKHRLQRKQEMETMARLLSERDAQIHQLQRDLEVERARNDQLRILMNTRLAGGAGANLHM